ncbi:hypothetical protein GP486_001285 [Trichoglossum hirsutum]|uniref:MYST-type HAT domain-containing protein n=1 Tax=Trichoglossum hirsutum TaxID=265104 RepID=A0A9P8LHF6_9PEZI|nr:hypothetical protein GP486_001285 [Trichoglossum hirsutum]
MPVVGAASPLQNSISAKVRENISPKKNSLDRTIQNVVLGDILFKTWYPSFYPEELINNNRSETERLYVCRWCFKYSKEIMPYMVHVDIVPLGRLIYHKDPYSVYEVDGDDQKLFCQNLSLFAKLFLDNKSIFYDVSTFLYYLLVFNYPRKPGSVQSSSPHQVIGFFSKEKMSWDNNNLACILVFPPWQRRGLGKILMGVSYELSKREGKLGGPEKPKKTFTVNSISESTYLLPEDIVTALKEMNVLNPKKRADGTVLASKAKVREWATANNVDLTPVVDPSALVDYSELETNMNHLIT